MKILAIAHVFYPRLWPELASCLRKLGPGLDLIVTYVDEAAVAEARRDFPEARFAQCENRGYDIGPFIQALKMVDLSAYDLVVKVHTKRDLRGTYAGYCCNNAWLGGSRWRTYLLAPFATRRNWRRTLSRFEDPSVGMVADRHVIFTGNAQLDDRAVFNRACELVSDRCGVVISSGRYVAGTMFVTRASVLARLGNLLCELSDFDAPADGHFTSLAHVLERAIGLVVSASGFRIEAFNGYVERRCAFYAGRGAWNCLLRFLFYRRYVDGEVKIKICGIQICHRKLYGGRG